MACRLGMMQYESDDIGDMLKFEAASADWFV